METIAITGYERDAWCEHCGRKLTHCIRTSDGKLVGATCFDKKITKPKVYQGKSYRIGSEGIIRLAKIAQFVHPSKWDAQHGVSSGNMTFEREGIKQ